MAKQHYLFTSESVTEGHPDKIADQISDAVLDTCIAQDPKSRVACETLVTTGLCLIAGEITTTASISYEEVARRVIREIGYTDANAGFCADTCAVLRAVDKQSADISVGVTEGEGLFKAQGAGDQGLMFGYACDETPELMPMPIVFAHKLTKALAQVRKSGELEFLRPDGKSQVTIEYVDNTPIRIDTVVISSQHSPDVDHPTLEDAIRETVIKKALPAGMMDDKTRFLINPTGRFVTGGPQGDCGLTGRKIIVDTYGGHGSHGGGAFSGKDPSKVDRSASYAARHVAKNIVAAGLAKRCEVQVAYAIGYPEPVSLLVDTYGTGIRPDEEMLPLIREVWNLSPAHIIKDLDLLRPIYQKTAAYGHFGRNEPEFTWEMTNKAERLKSICK
jgi:S-adenosylmethionine synthetase